MQAPRSPRSLIRLRPDGTIRVRPLRSTWYRRFARYLKDKAISRVQAAFELGRSTGTIHNWIHGSVETPPEAQTAVEKWSRGGVKSDATLSKRRQAA